MRSLTPERIDGNESPDCFSQIRFPFCQFNKEETGQMLVKVEELCV